jgi:hypothetical protein
VHPTSLTMNKAFFWNEKLCKVLPSFLNNSLTCT